jgi:RND family efflux transporter MFP subunit
LFLSEAKPSSARAPVPAKPLAVEVVSLTPKTVPARIDATGVVEATEELNVVPEVGGRVVYRAPELVPGGRFKKGALLIRIDATDYRLALEQEESRVAAAELELEQEGGRQIVAEREWRILKEAQEEASEDLVLRKPHLLAAQKNVESVKNSVQRAQANLGRTEIRAPFNATVIDEQVAVGQVVGPGTSIARLIGTDSFWVRASLPVARLSELTFANGAPDKGSVAEVRQRLGNQRGRIYEARVDRLTAALDPETRAAQVLLTVQAPLEVAEGELPLLPGAFADVAIVGKEQSEVFEIPREGLRDGDRVFVVKEGALAVRPVVIVMSRADSVFVRGELSAGDQLITSPIAIVVEGMPVKPSAALSAAKPPKPAPAEAAPEAEPADKAAAPSEARKP